MLGDDDAGALGACAQDNGVLAQGTCAFEALDVDRVVELAQSLALLFAFITVWILRLSQLLPGWVLSVVLIPFVIVPLLRYYLRLYVFK